VGSLPEELVTPCHNGQLISRSHDGTLASASQRQFQNVDIAGKIAMYTLHEAAP